MQFVGRSCEGCKQRLGPNARLALQLGRCLSPRAAVGLGMRTPIQDFFRTNPVGWGSTYQGARASVKEHTRERAVNIHMQFVNSVID